MNPSDIKMNNSNNDFKSKMGYMSGQNYSQQSSQAMYQNAMQYYMNPSQSATPPTPFYPSAVSPDLSSNLYSQMMNTNNWNVSPSSSTAMFDPSRPPPPPLPKTPAPKNPPLPPSQNLSSQNNMSSSLLNNSYYKGRNNNYNNHNNHNNHNNNHNSHNNHMNHNNNRGGYGNRRGQGRFRGGYNNRNSIPPSSSSPPVASQPPASGLFIKTPAALNGQTSNPSIENAKQHRFNGPQGPHGPIICKRKRRKPMSERLPTLQWKSEDAQRVLEIEKEYTLKRGDKAVIVRFPDPKLDYDIVKGFSPLIESVHFKQPAAPRSCIVHLKRGTEVKKVIEELNQTKFGLGVLQAEEKKEEFEDEELAIEDIDPYTLYVGNLPNEIDTKIIKDMFRTAKKVDIGFAQKMKLTRYGFVRYRNVEDAIESYKANYNAFYESRSLIVRFRRNNKSIGLSGERKRRKKDEQDHPEDEIETEKYFNEDGPAVKIANATSDFESEDEAEDSKTCVLERANAMMMENWLSDEMCESEDEAHNLPNLTGLIKTEPEDVDYLAAEKDDEIPEDAAAITSKDKPSTSKDQANTSKEQPSTPKDQPSTPKDQPSTPKDQPSTLKDQVSTPKDPISTPKDPINTAKDSVNTPKDQSNSSSNNPKGKDKNSPEKSKIQRNREFSLLTREVSKGYTATSMLDHDDWESIRQKELSEKEQKPDINSLIPSPFESSPQKEKATPTVPPITTYGLVPFILPKEEKEDTYENVGERTRKGTVRDDNKKKTSDFDGEFDDENADAAFENAWNQWND